MKRSLPLLVLLLTATAASSFAQETPATMVTAYEDLADTILAVKRMEKSLVWSILDGHHRRAEAHLARGDRQAAAAEMALFANEGDNAVAGVRKRLLEGGHHHNAAGEARGEYEPGYVVVTVKAKQQVLAAAADMRRARRNAQQTAAWNRFAKVAEALRTP